MNFFRNLKIHISKKIIIKSNNFYDFHILGFFKILHILKIKKKQTQTNLSINKKKKWASGKTRKNKELKKFSLLPILLLCTKSPFFHC